VTAPIAEGRTSSVRTWITLGPRALLGDEHTKVEIVREKNAVVLDAVVEDL
jgi:hypothetical protein